LYVQLIKFNWKSYYYRAAVQLDVCLCERMMHWGGCRAWRPTCEKCWEAWALSVIRRTTLSVLMTIYNRRWTTSHPAQNNHYKTYVPQSLHRKHSPYNTINLDNLAWLCKSVCTAETETSTNVLADAAAYAPGGRCVCTQRAAALFCVK